MVSVSVDSVAVMPRTPDGHGAEQHRVAEREQRADLERVGARIGDDQHAEESDHQRDPARRPTGSLSRNTSEASVANSGAEKLIAIALASGIMLNAISSNVCEVTCDMLRMHDGRRAGACGTRQSRRVGRMNAPRTDERRRSARLNSTSPTG